MPTGVYERTKENIEKMRAALTGRIIPEEARRNMSKALIGKSVSEKGHKSNCHCFCCKAKRGETKGKNHSQWKGGQFTDSDGYIHVLIPEHPRADNNGYVKRAHLIAEKTLGRYLCPEEITHHKNEKRGDDRPENIDAMTNGEHTYLHNKQRRINKSKSM